jgi:hypothetical protein
LLLPFNLFMDTVTEVVGLCTAFLLTRSLQCVERLLNF